MRNSLGSLLQKRRSKEQEEEQRRQLLGEGRMRRQVRPLLPLLLHVFLCLVALASDACEEVLLPTLDTLLSPGDVGRDRQPVSGVEFAGPVQQGRTEHPRDGVLHPLLSWPTERAHQGTHAIALCLGGGGDG